MAWIICVCRDRSYDEGYGTEGSYNEEHDSEESYGQGHSDTGGHEDSMDDAEYDAPYNDSPLTLRLQEAAVQNYQAGATQVSWT